VASQVEALPFATSFVDGTRPDPKLETSNSRIAGRTTYVINFWYKPSATYDFYYNYNAQTAKGQILQINNYASKPSLSYWIYQNDGIDPYLRSLINYASGWEATITIISNSYIEETLFNKWTMHTILVDGTTATFYVNGGEYKKTVTFTTPVAINYIKFTNAEGLIADPFIGNPYDENNNLVWTDTYIKQVYENRAPFNAS